LTKSAKTFDRINLPQCNVIAAQVRDEVDIFKPKVPIIVALRNPGMRDRHWDDLEAKSGADLPADKRLLSLQMLVDLGMEKKIEMVEKVAERASKEFGIETALDKMTKAWESVQLIVETYRETGTCILKGVDEYMSLLDEHITMTQAMAFSAFKGPFEERIDRWNTSLQVVSEVSDDWSLFVDIFRIKDWLQVEPVTLK
jgi:dynein heavy chain